MSDEYDSWTTERVEGELRRRGMVGSHSCYARTMDTAERARCDRSAGVALLRYMDRTRRRRPADEAAPEARAAGATG